MTKRKPTRAKGLGVTPEMYDVRNCTRCGELLPVDSFYFVSKKLGTRRGQCKECIREVKAAQRDPNWVASCSRCGNPRTRSGSGRRLCDECFDAVYDREDRRPCGAHRQRLKPCPACGAKRLRADHMKGSSLCPICRSVPQHRRKSLRSFYNMTPPEYLELLAAQRESCAICHRRATKPLHVDHSHGEPRLIRGLVCNSCNTMLGLAKDDPTRLRAAAAFLEAPTAQSLFPGRVANAEANRPGQPFRRLRRFA